jgi:hypothetical protein
LIIKNLILKLNLMKKTYYVYSIFEKLNLTAGLKSLVVLLMFSVCFLGSGTEASAQSFGTSQNNVANIDLNIFKNYDLKEDKSSASLIVRNALQELLDSNTPTGGVAEATYSSKVFFLQTLGGNLSANTTVMTALMHAYSDLGNFVGRFNNNIKTQIDLEDIADTYATMLQ